MKFLIICASVLALSSYVSAASMFWGQLEPTSTLIFTKIYTNAYDSPVMTFHSETHIKAVRVTDLTPGPNNLAIRLTGGPGSTHITLRFKPENGPTYSFMVEIYG